MAVPVAVPVPMPMPVQAPPHASEVRVDAGNRAPVIDAACVTTTCASHHGFPAVSADGATVAIDYVEDTGERDSESYAIHLLDAHTSQLLRSITILAVDEDPSSTAIAPRAAAANQLLAAGGYRTMQPLGALETNTAEITALDPSVHVAIAGTDVRVDGAFQHAFAIEEPARSPSVDPSLDTCGGWGMRRHELWWDVASHTVVSRQDYQTGGCMCTDDHFDLVYRY